MLLYDLYVDLKQKLFLVLIETGTMKNLKVSTMPAVIHLTNPFPARNLLPVTVRMLDRALKSGLLIRARLVKADSWRLRYVIFSHLYIDVAGYICYKLMYPAVPYCAHLTGLLGLIGGSRGMCLIGLKIQRICEAQLLLKTKSWCFKIGQTVFKGILNIYFTRSCDVGYYINLIVYMLHTWSSSNIKEDQGLVMVFCTILQRTSSISGKYNLVFQQPKQVQVT